MKSSFLSILRFLLGLTALFGAGAALHAAPPGNGTVGVAYSYQISTSPPAAAGTVYSAIGLPPGLAIGSSNGAVSGVPTTAGTYSGTFSLTANSATNNLPFTIVIAGAAGTPVITGAATASGQVGTAFTTYTPAASPAATSFSVTGLPPGLTANPSTGAISGTPTLAGAYSVAINGTDASGPGTALPVTITIAAAAGSPVISNSPLTLAVLPGVVMTPYQVTATGSPTSFSASGLPGGLSIDSTTGLITGTPTATGVTAVSVAASNGTVGAASTLTITAGAVVTNAATAAATTGGSFSLQLAASPSAASFNVSGLPTGLSATAAGLISGTPTSTGTFALTVSGNTVANSVTYTGPSSTITLTVTAGGGGGFTGGGGGGVITPVPTITTQPSAATVTVGGTANFAVTALSSTGGALAYQWLFNSAAISGQTASTLSLTNVQTANAGLYSVAVTAVGGTTVTSSTAQLTVNAAPTPVTISTQPISQSVTQGGNVTFTVAASGSGTLTYQWSKNGTAIAGATGASYSITNVGAADQASYTVTVGNGTTSATSSQAVLTVTAPVAATRLLNVSILGASGGNQQNLVVGFTVGGTGSKSVLARVIGPTLGVFGVANFMADPQLTIVNGAQVQVAFDDDWGGGTALSNAFTQTGAFALPLTSKDAALLLNLTTGTYTANVSGANNTTGTVLVEAYDADTAANPTARLINLSARGFAGSGSNTMTVGFIISGTAPKTVLLRGIGPTLAGFGIAAPLSSTQLTLFQGTTALQSNTGWGGTAALVTAFNQVNAFQLPLTSADSALLLTLAPGTYTAQLTAAGSSSATGVALLELYDVQ